MEAWHFRCINSGGPCQCFTETEIGHDTAGFCSSVGTITLQNTKTQTSHCKTRKSLLSLLAWPAPPPPASLHCDTIKN